MKSTEVNILAGYIFLKIIIKYFKVRFHLKVNKLKSSLA